MKHYAQLTDHVHGLMRRLKKTKPPRYVLALAVAWIVVMPMGIATTAVVLPMYLKQRERRMDLLALEGRA